MRINKYLFIISILILSGCDSESDDVNITNNYITESPTEEQSLIGDFELKTVSETDFFVVAKEIDSLEFYYSNSNNFHFDKSGYLVNSSGSPLLVYPVNLDGSSASTSISVSQQIKIDYEVGNPKATYKVNVGVNLPNSADELLSGEFSNQDLSTFNYSTSVTVFDSLGEGHILTFYFIHVSVDNNTWELRVALDGNTVESTIEKNLDFSPSGLLDVNDDDLDGFTTTDNGLIAYQNIPLSNGANDLTMTFDFATDTTSFNSNFEVTLLESSRFFSGSLNEFKVDSDGLITLSYINGEDKLLGRVALAKFYSPYNLHLVGDSLWEETEDSGVATFAESGINNFGTIIPIVHDY